MKERRYRCALELGIDEVLRMQHALRWASEHSEDELTRPQKQTLAKLDKEVARIWAEHKQWRRETFKCARRAA